MLTYETQRYGHAVLITGCTYNTVTQKYELSIYDENSVSLDAPLGEFTTMYINKDFSGFAYTEPDEITITQDAFITMAVHDWNVIDNISRSSWENTSETINNHVFLNLTLNEGFCIENDNGDYLSYDGEKFSGDMLIYSVNPVVNDNSAEFIIETDYSTNFILKDISDNIELSVYDDNDYMSLSGSEFDLAEFSFDDGLNIEGSDYSFEAYISVDQNVDTDENGLVCVAGIAASNVAITTQKSFVEVKSEENLSEVSASSLIGSDVYDIPVEDSDELTLSAHYKGGDNLSGLPYGDINGDNKVTIFDSLLAQRSMLQLCMLNSLQKDLADIDGNGRITLSDCIEIQRYAVGYSSETKVGKI